MQEVHIRRAKGGYILEVPWPYGASVIGLGEVVCKTWPEVLEVLGSVFHIETQAVPASGGEVN